MHIIVNEYLERIEKEKNITILLAVESGSRAWGFASENSDWDVRVIYTRKDDWYNSLNKNWDETFTSVGENDLDVHGWLLPKALNLLNKGNSAVHEWINSPIVYRKNPTFYARLAILSKGYFNPLPTIWHYVALAQGNYHRYIEDKSEYKLKRLLYVWRAVMVSKYVMKYLKFPGTAISILLDSWKELEVPVQIQSKVNRLLAMKKAGTEMGVGTWEEYSDLLEWLALEIDNIKLHLQSGNIAANKADIEPLNRAFRRFK